MTLKQLINKLLEKDSYEMLLWLQFLAKKIDCRECVRIYVEKRNYPPNCSRCVPASSLIHKAFKNSGKGDSNHEDK